MFDCGVCVTANRSVSHFRGQVREAGWKWECLRILALAVRQDVSVSFNVPKASCWILNEPTIFLDIWLVSIHRDTSLLLFCFVFLTTKTNAYSRYFARPQIAFNQKLPDVLNIRE